MGDTGTRNAQPGVEKTNRGDRAWGWALGPGNGWPYQGQHRKTNKVGRESPGTPLGQAGQARSCCKGDGTRLQDGPHSQGACPRAAPPPAPLAPWHPRSRGLSSLCVSHSSSRAQRKGSEGDRPLTQRACPRSPNQCPAPLAHRSSLFLQMHSPIISLISGSCTFSKLAGLMPWR